MQNKYILFLLFLCSNFLTAQNILKLKVSDNIAPINNCIVVVSQNNKQIIFDTTDANGNVQIELPSGTSEIKISHLGYKTITKSIAIEKDTFLEVLLEESINKLETVTIKSRPTIIKVKEDTISYNIKKVIDGTERKIEDVIKKLPGLDVDSNGKVSYKGNLIDNVLIDGNEFFNNKHQMATQNIDAKMIEGIELLTNYEGFAKASKKKIALNLKTKDEYKNKWVGDIELNSGLNSPIKFHNNLFKFLKKGNFTVITDYNSIGRLAISSEDFNEMIISEFSEETGKNTSASPTILNQNTPFKSKETGFVGVNYSSVFSNKFKLTFSNFSNLSKQTEKSKLLQTSLNDDLTVRSREDFKKSSLLINNPSLKLEFNKSDKSYFSYYVGLMYSNEKTNDSVRFQVDNINTRSKNQAINLNQSFKYIYTKSKSFDYKFLIESAIKNNVTESDFNSNLLLFETPRFLLNQELKLKSDELNVSNSIRYSISSNDFSLKSTFRLSTSETQNINYNESTFNNYQKLSRQNLALEIGWIKRWSAKIQTISYLNVFSKDSKLESSSSNFVRAEPKIKLNYVLNPQNKFSFNYEKKFELPALAQYENGGNIIDFQSIRNESLIDINQIKESDRYSVDFYNLTESSNFLYTVFNYSKSNNAFSENINFRNGFIERSNVVANYEKQMQALLYYDFKIKVLPISFKNTITYLKTDGFAFYDSQESNNILNAFSLKHNLYTRLKKSNVQFEIGYNYKESDISFSYNSYSNKTISNEFLTKIRGKYRSKIIWDASYGKLNQKSNFVSINQDIISGNMQIEVINDTKLIINAHNILNIDRNNIVNTGNRNGFFTESVTEVIRGYVMVGLNYTF